MDYNICLLYSMDFICSNESFIPLQFLNFRARVNYNSLKNCVQKQKEWNKES